MSNLGSKVKSFFQNMVRPPPASVLQQAASQVIPPLKPHVPLIKFRKGSGGSMAHSTPARAAPLAAAPGRAPGSQPASGAKPNATTRLPIIEDWQLPPHLRRRPIPQEEIDCINRGGGQP